MLFELHRIDSRVSSRPRQSLACPRAAGDVRAARNRLSGQQSASTQPRGFTGGWCCSLSRTTSNQPRRSLAGPRAGGWCCSLSRTTSNRPRRSLVGPRAAGDAIRAAHDVGGFQRHPSPWVLRNSSPTTFLLKYPLQIPQLSPSLPSSPPPFSNPPTLQKLPSRPSLPAQATKTPPWESRIPWRQRGVGPTWRQDA